MNSTCEGPFEGTNQFLPAGPGAWQFCRCTRCAATLRYWWDTAGLIIVMSSKKPGFIHQAHLAIKPKDTP